MKAATPIIHKVIQMSNPEISQQAREMLTQASRECRQPVLTVPYGFVREDAALLAVERALVHEKEA